MTTAAVFSQASGGVLIASPVNRTAHRWLSGKAEPYLVPRNRNGSRSGLADGHCRRAGPGRPGVCSIGAGTQSFTDEPGSQNEAALFLRPAQFSVFPSLLLLLTLFRLSLNLASSRRILLHGNEGAGAAGRPIEAFGQFVVGGNYVVGFVLFLALIGIQYVVVSHGAVRTTEVTARFILDALPGKQMAIDADLNAGLIDEIQARARREQIAHEAEFYGAMDGAARFNERDGLATILITAVNIFAGFLIGVFQLDIPSREALKTYTVLTVGDGLVTMIPSLLVSMAGGMVVTRASSDSRLSIDLGRQLLAR
jgi:flagellar biosynthesis protein FlhA